MTVALQWLICSLHALTIAKQSQCDQLLLFERHRIQITDLLKSTKAFCKCLRVCDREHETDVDASDDSRLGMNCWPRVTRKTGPCPPVK